VIDGLTRVLIDAMIAAGVARTFECEVLVNLPELLGLAFVAAAIGYIRRPAP
jgi:hypothetical protein